MKHVVFHELDQLWFRHSDSLAVKVLPVGSKIPEFLSGVKAATYTEAYETLYGEPFTFVS